MLYKLRDFITFFWNFFGENVYHLNILQWILCCQLIVCIIRNCNFLTHNCNFFLLLDILKSFKNRYLRFMWKKLVRRQQNSDPTICFFLAKKVSWKVIRKLNNPFLFLLSPKKNVVEKPKRHFFLHIMFFGNILGILNYKKKPHTYRKKLIEKKICFLKNRKSLFGHQEMIWPVLATHTHE